MTHDYPMVLAPALAPPGANRLGAPPGARPAVLAPGSWRYPAVPGSRRRVVVALLLSAGFHASLLLAVRSHPAVVAKADNDHLIAVSIAMPDLKDLEEPEPLPKDDLAEKLDPAEYAPSLMDAPQIALPTDFVQEINFASLIPQPDLNQAKVFVIPHNILRSGKLGEGLGNIFNLADLDQHPQPVVQPSPVFPPQLKREVTTARVVVEFVVDTEGRVRNAYAVESSHDGFNEAAVVGVNKWRFRAGLRGGIKVNVRMSVPIIFRLMDSDS